MELFLDVLGESLVDTAKMLPFLFLAYLFIEYVENRHGERIEAILAGGGRWGSVPAALLGCVPQCGFSAIASNFYASRVISLGTLMAVFLATSDEAVPLLVSMPAYWNKLVLLMVIKVLYAIAVGLVLDFAFFAVLLVCIIVAAKRGFVLSLMELVGFFLAGACALSLSGLIAPEIYDRFFAQQVTQAIAARLPDLSGAATAAQQAHAALESLPDVIAQFAASLGIDTAALAQKILGGS